MDDQPALLARPLPAHPRRNTRAPNPESSTLASLEFDRDKLPRLSHHQLTYNICMRHDSLEGGQACVYLSEWENVPATAQPALIADGRRVAIKHCLQAHGGGRFPDITTLEELRRAADDGQKCLDRELEMLQRLHDTGCGERVVCPLAQTRWAGWWSDDPDERAKYWWEPTFAYVMPAYRLGSVRSLLDDICNRRAPESVQQRFLSMSFISGEMATLLAELRKIHNTKKGAGLMIQDITPGNLLVDDEFTGGGGMRLLLSDPGMAAKIVDLRQSAAGSRRHVTGTWLWGSMAARSGRYDEGADLYSLSAVGVEMWLVAEGAHTPAGQMALMLQSGQRQGTAQGVQFVRHLVLETVKIHNRRGKLNPRSPRHLPVSWLGAWALLLGCRDHKAEVDMQCGRPHLRPSEADMLRVYEQWARIAAAAEALPLDISCEQAAGPGCAALVADMCSLFEELKRLSQLDQEGELEDTPTRWFAANFLGQDHPLADAMQAQGALGVGEADDMSGRNIHWYNCREGWCHAVQVAQHAARHASPAAGDDQECTTQQGGSPHKRKPSEHEPAEIPEHRQLLPRQNQRQQLRASSRRAAVSRPSQAVVPAPQLLQQQHPAQLAAPPVAAEAADADAFATMVAHSLSGMSLRAPPAIPPGAADARGIGPLGQSSSSLLGSPSKRARTARQRSALPGTPSSAATAATAAGGGHCPASAALAALTAGNSSGAAGPAPSGGSGAAVPAMADSRWAGAPRAGGGSRAAAGHTAPLSAGPAAGARVASDLPYSHAAAAAQNELGIAGITVPLSPPAAGLLGWSCGGSEGLAGNSPLVGFEWQPGRKAAATAASAASEVAAATPVECAQALPAAAASSPAMLPLPYAGQLGGSDGSGGSTASLPMALAQMQPMPRLQEQPAGQPARQPLSQLGTKFGVFPYQLNTALASRWGTEEHAYAKRIVDAFAAHCTGLKDRALYNGCQADAVADYSAEQVQETRAAKQELLATFQRCFPARYEAGVADGSKKIRDKARRILGHRE